MKLILDLNSNLWNISYAWKIESNFEFLDKRYINSKSLRANGTPGSS